MAIVNVAGRTDLLGQHNNGTTSAIDTTGATLIVVSLVWYSGITSTATFTDSKSNTWTDLTFQNAGDSKVQLFYCVNPTVGSGHTWTGGSEADTYSMIQILGFSGTHASSPYDQESGAIGAAVASLQPGSLTPAQANQLFVTAELNIGTGLTTGLPTGYTGAAVEFTGGVNVGGGIAYKIQSGGAAAENPAWTWSGGTADAAAAVMATFKEAAAGGGTTFPSWMVQGAYW